MPHEQGARALRFGSGEAGEGVDGDKPTRRGLPPAAFLGMAVPQKGILKGWIP